MTGSLVLTVTNTGPDDKAEMGPVFGAYTPEEDDDSGDTTLGSVWRDLRTVDFGLLRRGLI